MALALSGDGLWLLIAVLIAAGLAAGFLSGLLGIGGGGILVPVLYEAFGLAGVPEDVRMHMALGTTLAVIAPTVLRSLAAHFARGAVDVPVVMRIGRWVWVVFGTLLAVKMALGRDDWRLADQLPRPPFLEGIAFGIGTISTLMGIGGATFTVPLLTLHGKPLLQSVATATGIGPIIAVPGIIGYIWSGWGMPGLPPYSLGYVSLGALLIMPLSVFAAPYGVRMAHGIDKRRLELAFAAFISCVVVRFLWTLI
jgi:uncharacterized protein